MHREAFRLRRNDRRGVDRTCGTVRGGKVGPPFLWLPPSRRTWGRLKRNRHPRYADAEKVGVPGVPFCGPAFPKKNVPHKMAVAAMLATAKSEIVRQ